jgi:hypothetical protein
LKAPAKSVPALYFVGSKIHIFATVPLLLFLLSSVSGKCVFYVLLGALQLYVAALICLALFFDETQPLAFLVGLVRFAGSLAWGGLCFILYALVVSIIYAACLKLPAFNRPGHDAAFLLKGLTRETLRVGHAPPPGR